MKSKKCIQCNNNFTPEPYRFNKAKYCGFKCYWESKKGKSFSPSTQFKKGQFSREKHPQWNGGRTRMGSGYILILKPDHPNCNKHTGYVYEHRLVMENKIGRYLKSNEYVHHIDGNVTNNKITNLVLLKNSKHTKEHWKNGSYDNVSNKIKEHWANGRMEKSRLTCFTTERMKQMWEKRKST